MSTTEGMDMSDQSGTPEEIKNVTDEVSPEAENLAGEVVSDDDLGAEGNERAERTAD
ncbi:MAG: hypothetical protein ACTHOG_07830 [Marmoricola sp.]